VAQTEALPVIVETISINAPASAVFAALTEPGQVMQWWGSDDGYKMTAMESDLRVGAWKTSGTGSTGNPIVISGVYRIIDAPRALELTWRHTWFDDDDIPSDTVVRYDLEERNGSTFVRVTHTGFTNVEEHEDHAEGWPVVLAWLRAYAQR
jgi:uncharacterized protein YndB with AHSA1/START domain